MDGNRRWAKKKFLPVKLGHQKGAENIKKICEYLHEIKIPYVTFYAFSTENWKRGGDQVDELFDLMRKYINNDLENMKKDERFCLNIIGDIEKMPEDIKNALLEIKNSFLPNENKLNVTFAINYGSLDEVNRAINRIITERKGEISGEEIFQYLDTKNIPNPDVIIRTGGEKRLSNFLLLQSSYAEIYFRDELWPDFSKNDLNIILLSFINTNRNHGA